MQLETIGWHTFFADHFTPFTQQGLIPARVAREHQHIYSLYAEAGELAAVVSGRLRHNALERQDFPAVGDWVAIRPPDPGGQAVIQAILPRRSKFSRKAADTVADEQVVAANIDTVFLVMGLDHDFNLRRLERYLIMAWESGATPVVVLNKGDLCPDPEARATEVMGVAPGVAIHAVSAAACTGLEALAAYTLPGKTVALLGSSGVGKSSISNRLLGREAQRVQEIRADDGRGRHTTTYRELLVLPQGGLLIDTPGMRELQLWSAHEGLGDTFADVESLGSRCRFRDCRHAEEPGCAIRQALEDRELDAGRFRNYLALQRELRHVARKTDQKARLAQKARWKRIHKAMRAGKE